MQMPIFLKCVLMLDAASCLAMGAGLTLGAGSLAPLLGLPQSLLLGAGLSLVPIGLFILWAATRQRIAPLFVYAIVGGNLLWVIESLMVADGAQAITPAGTIFVLGQAAAVAIVTLMEIVGLVQSRADVRPAEVRA